MGWLQMLLGEEPGPIKRWIHGGDKGRLGEYLTEYALRNHNIPGYGRTLHNLYIPYGGRGSEVKTVEIDVLLIHEKGVFVFESKNYSGWIYGSEDQRTWTQSMPGGHKNHFYNPLLQNEAHIGVLARFLQLPDALFKSYIIFSERCELKKVPPDSELHTIVKRPGMLRAVKRELRQRRARFSREEVDEMYQTLSEMANVSKKQKKRHVKQVREACR